MKAISNSSILIALSAIEQETLLIQRFPDGILVPRAVWQEVVEQGKGRIGAERIAAFSWIKVHEVQDKEFTSLLRIQIDYGEAEAIALYREHGADMVLLDEKEARKIALRMNIPILGTIGMLIWGKRTGLINSLKNYLDILQNDFDFYIGSQVYQKALRAVRED